MLNEHMDRLQDQHLGEGLGEPGLTPFNVRGPCFPNHELYFPDVSSLT